MRLKLPEECEFSLETHEPDVTALLRKLIQPGFKVIDVGAHIGYFTLLISRLVGREGKVFALEPLPNNVKRLKEHLSRNNCSQNTKVLELAAADYDGEEQFLEFGFATVGRLASTGLFVSDKPRGRMTVKCRSLDSLLSEGCIESPDFVKIDVEGAELWVLKGMENLIKIHKPKLLVEMHDKKIAEDIINFLENKGYKAYYLNKDALRKLNFAQPDLVNKSILFICNCA
jgi:FkbM family methyltransferase